MSYNIIQMQMETQKQKIYRMLRSLSPKEQRSAIKQHQVTNVLMQNTMNKNKGVKNKLCVNKSNRRINNQGSNKYIFNRTTAVTPFQKSTMLSLVSTPNEKSYNNNYLSFLNTNDKFRKQRNNFKKNTTICRQQLNLEFTEEVQFDMNSIRINFVIGTSKILSKYFQSTISFKHLKQVFVKEILPEKLKNHYYGLVDFKTVPFDYLLERLIKTSPTLQAISQNNTHEITLEPIMVKSKVNYNKMEFNDFEIIRHLGSGGFSSVYLGRCLLDGNYCALKFIKKDTITSPKKVKMLENQKNILFSINHENLIDLYYAFETQNCIVFGLQYCPYGNLYNFLQKHQYLSEDNAKCIFKQILKGLQYLHQNNILFRDIKLENILFDLDGKIKITDFGLSKPDVQSDEITFSYCGSPEYMAPEMLSKLGHSYQVDYYALGIILYELLFGKSPFYAPKKEDIFAAILNSEPEFPKSHPISKQAKSLIQGLLTKNPHHRIGSLKGIKQISTHPWLRKNQMSVQQFFKKQKETLRDTSPLRKFQSPQELKVMKEIFEEEKKFTKSQKYFFEHSFVNRRLFSQILENCVVFTKEKSLERTMKKSQKKKGPRFL